MEWTVKQREWAVNQANDHLATVHPIGADPGVTVGPNVIQCRSCTWTVLLLDNGACAVAYGPFLPTVTL